MKITTFVSSVTMVLVLTVSSVVSGVMINDKISLAAFSETYTVSSDNQLEKPEEVFDTPFCFYQGTGDMTGLSIWGEATQTVALPMDGDLARDLLVVNNTAYDVRLEEAGTPVISGELATHTEEQFVIFHPNPMNFHLYAGDTQRCVMTISFSRLGDFTSDYTGKLGIQEHLAVYYSKDGSGEKKGQEISLDISSDVSVYTAATMEAEKNRTATIAGTVKDSKGNPVKNARIRVSGGFLREQETNTDEKGKYSIKVYPTYNTYDKTWHQYKVFLDFADKPVTSTLVRPEKDKTVTKDFTLPPNMIVRQYKKTSTVDIGVQGYYFDTSKDGSVFATVPFHSDLPASEVAKNAYLNIFGINGTALARVPMEFQTPYVDITPDGKYIATQFGYDNDSSTTSRIYDQSGKELYSRKDFPAIDWVTKKTGESRPIKSRASCLSDDGSRLAVGSGNGELYYIDWKNDQILWTFHLHGQIRTIDHSTDGSLLYASSGDGHLYCFRVNDGTLLWKTYIGSWGTSIAVGKKYVALSTKCAKSSLRVLDAITGKQLWVLDTPARGYVSMSPDESMLYFANDTASSYSLATGEVMETATGKVLFATQNGGMNGAWSSDGKYFAMKTATDVFVYSSKNGALLWADHLTDFVGGTTVLAFSADAKYLVAGYNAKQGYGTLNFYQFEKETKEGWPSAQNPDRPQEPDAPRVDQFIIIKKPASGIVNIKASSLKNKSKKVTIKAKAKTAVKYKVNTVPHNGNKYISLSKKSGKKTTVTIRQGAPKGLYQIKLTAAQNNRYKRAKAEFVAINVV